MEGCYFEGMATVLVVTIVNYNNDGDDDVVGNE